MSEMTEAQTKARTKRDICVDLLDNLHDALALREDTHDARTAILDLLSDALAAPSTAVCGWTKCKRGYNHYHIACTEDVEPGLTDKAIYCQYCGRRVQETP